MTEAPSDDEVLVTKWLMVGAVLWESPNGTWFAIMPGNNEHSFAFNTSGETPAQAVSRFVKEYGKHIGDMPWLVPLLEHVKSSTSSDLGPTPPHTAQ